MDDIDDLNAESRVSSLEDVVEQLQEVNLELRSDLDALVRRVMVLENRLVDD